MSKLQNLLNRKNDDVLIDFDIEKHTSQRFYRF